LIWEEVLGQKGIGATDDFFDIGGHSLRVTKLIALIHQKMGIQVPLASVFESVNDSRIGSTYVRYRAIWRERN